jgi:hypothetical protein
MKTNKTFRTNKKGEATWGGLKGIQKIKAHIKFHPHEIVSGAHGSYIRLWGKRPAAAAGTRNSTPASE